MAGGMATIRGDIMVSTLVHLQYTSAEQELTEFYSGDPFAQ
jgi:hypothetical protein